MKNFNARIEGENDIQLDASMFEEVDGRAPKDVLIPGNLLIMGTNGKFTSLGSTTIDMSNKHKVYYCNSFGLPVTKQGNSMVSGIPVAQKFEFDITFVPGDEAMEDGTVFAPGVLIAIKSGVYAEAQSNDYVIGSVKSGNATADNGGTICVNTVGGDYKLA